MKNLFGIGFPLRGLSCIEYDELCLIVSASDVPRIGGMKTALRNGNRVVNDEGTRCVFRFSLESDLWHGDEPGVELLCYSRGDGKAVMAPAWAVAIANTLCAAASLRRRKKKV